MGKVSRRRTGWLTWEDSNFDIPISKNTFEMSAEFPLLWPKTRLGDFCSCKLWKRGDAETAKTSECVPYIGYPRSGMEREGRVKIRGFVRPRPLSFCLPTTRVLGLCEEGLTLGR